ncbi:MAG: histidine kinase [Bacteroidetes bacterium]|nr:histidine kinase [Bacteroidota bacterium]
MKRSRQIYTLSLVLILFTSSKGKGKTELAKGDTASKNKEAVTSQGPKNITRNIIQDRKGNIWIAAFDGIFRYDGKSFTNITSKVSSARFFSVLEDRKGNLWFGSIGSGVYNYDGKSFRNFTTKDGLAGNDVGCIYEDKTGNIWFGTQGGISRYDGKSFRNYTTKDGLPDNDINTIVEDKTGKFWVGTRGNACFYDGKTFTSLTYNGKPFTNIRTIIKDKKGNIWLGGHEGLWRRDGNIFTHFTHNFIGHVYEDKDGNIWTSSENTNDRGLTFSGFDAKSLSSPTSANDRWILSRYDEKFLSDKKPAVKEITPKHGMLCGILEAIDGSIWFCASDGVYRYDGNRIISFNGKEGQK